VQEAVVALERALGPAIAGIEDDPAERELVAEGEEGLSRAAARRDRPLAVPDQLLRQAPSRARQRLIPQAMSGNSFREDERSGEGARVRQLAGHDVAAPRLVPAGRDLRLRLAQVELRQLAGPVDGALEASRRRQVARPQLAQKIVEDRLAPS
jgi:hypothetical protein